MKAGAVVPIGIAGGKRRKAAPLPKLTLLIETKDHGAPRAIGVGPDGARYEIQGVERILFSNVTSTGAVRPVLVFDDESVRTKVVR